MSILRYTVGTVFGVLSVAVLFLLTRIDTPWIFLVVWFVWFAGQGLFGWYLGKKLAGEPRELPLILFNTVAVTVLLIILEDNLWRYSLIGLAGLMMGWLFVQAGRRVSGLSYEERPYRRVRMMLWVFVAYAILTLIYALNSFFPTMPFWPISLIGSAVAALISLLIWRMYFAVSWQSLFLWAIVIGLGVWEIIWVQHFLPFGYLVLGALTVWIWYVIQLLVRFHLGQHGIIWRKQISFLVANLVLYTLLLWLFVRWI